MYITTDSTKHYAVASTALGIVEMRYQLEEAPATLGAAVKLFADDGAGIREDAVAAWEHPRIEGNTIVLSNTAPAVPVMPTLAEVQSAKLTEINAACDAAITAGCDVTLSDGTAGHISLTLPDQINLSTAQEAIAAGKTGYAYHLDGALCEIYQAADIAIMWGAERLWLPSGTGCWPPCGTLGRRTRAKLWQYFLTAAHCGWCWVHWRATS